MRALCLIRESPVYRADAFRRGLKKAGYELVPNIKRPEPTDIVVCWNRYGNWHEQATRFEQAGARAVIVENGYLGKDWLGGGWYAMALGHHAGAGKWPAGPQWRWDSLKVELAPWREGGTETIVLGQRGIGEPGLASPDGWAQRVAAKVGGRIRKHPGTGDSVPLEHDLRNASSVVTWASSAALLALMMGIPVWYEMPQWIGAEACRPLSEFGGEPLRDDAARLRMFQRLIWAMWNLDEIQSGYAFRHLLA